MDSFISWIGGKNALKREIINRFPDKIGRYIEVFGGAGWVLFDKDKHAALEVYNDFNSDLVNLFKCVKYHCPEVQREMLYMLNSREVFMQFRDQYNLPGATDIQRAARFLFLIKMSYGSNLRSYGCMKRDITVVQKYIDGISARLAPVVIENKDFEDLIKVYDKPDALFYLDPPYFGTEKYYQAKFRTEDHVRLMETLRTLKGKFLLSYNDCEEIRELYKDYKIEGISRQHNLHARYDNMEKNYSELLIKNY